MRTIDARENCLDHRGKLRLEYLRLRILVDITGIQSIQHDQLASGG